MFSIICYTTKQGSSNRGRSKAGGFKHLVRDEGDSELFVNHEGKDSHLGRTSLVELDGTLGELGLGIEGVPSEVKGSVAEISDEFSSGDVLHDSKFKESDESNNLGNSSSRDGLNGTESRRNGSERGAGVVNVSWKTDAGLGNEVSNNGKHGDTSVLDLDVSETVELVLVTIRDEAQRIEESERSLGTELGLEGHGDSSGLGSLLGRGEGGSRGDEGGDDDRLHGNCWQKKIVRNLGANLRGGDCTPEKVLRREDRHQASHSTFNLFSTREKGISLVRSS
jgi:hypothetical protein